MSSPTSSPAFMMRRTWAPSLVCLLHVPAEDVADRDVHQVEVGAEQLALGALAAALHPHDHVLPHGRCPPQSPAAPTRRRPVRRSAGHRRRINAPGIGDREHVLLTDQDRGVLVQHGRDAGGPLGLVGLAVPGGHLAGLSYIPERAHQVAVDRPLPAVHLGDPVGGEVLHLGVHRGGQRHHIDPGVGPEQPSAGGQHPVHAPGAPQRRRHRDPVVGEVGQVDAVAPGHLAQVAQAERGQHRPGRVGRAGVRAGPLGGPATPVFPRNRP